MNFVGHQLLRCCRAITSGCCWTARLTLSGLKISTLCWTTTRLWRWRTEIAFRWLPTVRSSSRCTTSTTPLRPPCRATEWCSWAAPSWTGIRFSVVSSVFNVGWRCFFSRCLEYTEMHHLISVPSAARLVRHLKLKNNASIGTKSF